MPAHPFIDTARAHEWQAALELALQHVDEPARRTRVLNALALLGSGEIVADGIWVARRGSIVDGAQVCIPLPGATGLLWPPQCRHADPNVYDALVRAGVDWLISQGVKLVQALLPAEELRFAGPLLRQGFRHITRLVYMQHDLLNLAAASKLLRWQTYAEAERQTFLDTLMITYDGTLDCPELNGVRSVDEVITGYRLQNRHDPQQWWLAWEGERPVGVVITDQLPDSDAWELSYLGLAPDARGRGLGSELVLHALRSASAAASHQLRVAVDERNYPALQLYQRLGFVRTDYREVFLQIHLPALAT